MSDPLDPREWLREEGAKASDRSDDYEGRRASVRRLNLVTVVLPAVVAIVAGLFAAIPAQPKVEWLFDLPWASVLSGIAAILVTIHGVLRCDEYQAECLRLSRAIRAFAGSARAALTLSDDRFAGEYDRLTTRLEVLTEGIKETVPRRYFPKVG